MRKIFSYSILMVTVLWLVLSYIPSSFIQLPQFSFHVQWIESLFPSLMATSLVVFLAIQLILVRSTIRFCNPSDAGQKTAQNTAQNTGQTTTIQLNTSAEIFWTAIPIVMTLLLAAVVLFANSPLWVN